MWGEYLPGKHEKKSNYIVLHTRYKNTLDDQGTLFLNTAVPINNNYI